MAADSLLSTPECLGVGVGDTLDQVFLFLATVCLFCSVMLVPITFGHWSDSIGGLLITLKAALA